MKHARKPDLKDEENGELSSKTAYNNRRESCEEMASSIEQLAKSVSELGIGKEQRRSLSKGKCFQFLHIEWILTYDFIKQQRSNHLAVVVAEQDERKRHQCLATTLILRHPMPSLTNKSYAIFWRRRILKGSSHSFMIRAKASLMTFRVKQKSKQTAKEQSKSFILLPVLWQLGILITVAISVIVRITGTRNN